ncbi:metallophosphoesterase [Candidatus Saganbacteria bacterium]|nr:metallophosphoesterase [Candidatus Saganbacteria bacterium]
MNVNSKFKVQISKPQLKIHSILIILVFLSSVVFSATTQEVFSFAVFGDNRDGDKVFVALLKKIDQEPNLAFAFNTGDFVPSGQEQQYRHYLKMLSQSKIKVFNIPGNHDLVGQGEANFKKYFGPLYYSFDYSNAHFIVINNAFGRYFDRRQFTWLQNDLAVNTRPHTFVFMHRPTFDPSEIYQNYVMSGRGVVEELMALFEKHKVDYVFAGHIHGYAKALRDNVTYVITGGGGAPLYLPRDFGGFFHYVRIDVVREKIKDRVIRLDD